MSSDQQSSACHHMQGAVSYMQFGRVDHYTFDNFGVDKYGWSNSCAHDRSSSYYQGYFTDAILGSLEGLCSCIRPTETWSCLVIFSCQLCE